MKIWTYLEMLTKATTDTDMVDESFCSPNEIAGYFNEAVGEAAAEIIGIKEDYFKTRYWIPVVAGQNVYNLPTNIFANKIREIMYANGTLIYEVRRFRRRDQALKVSYSDQFGLSDDYRYRLMNDNPGQAVIEFHPTLRETAILAPQTALFTPLYLEYIRDCARVPMIAVNGQLGELCHPEVFATTQVNVGTNQIQSYSGVQTTGVLARGIPGAYPGSIAYVTGDILRFTPGPGGTLPAPLAINTDYYVIAGANGLIQLASSLQNALTATPIVLTTVGTVYFSCRVRATQNIVNAVLIDVPEFSTFVIQWVKCRLAEKQGHPLLDKMANTLVEQKELMVNTLTEAVEDDDNEIEADYSHYQEMS